MMNGVWYRLILVAALGQIACSAGRETGSTPESITLFAAASTTDAIEEITQIFSQQTNIPVRLNFAASSTLAQQIESGADADLFLSAHPQWADYLDKKGLIAKQAAILQNKMVMIVPTQSRLEIHTPEDLLMNEIKHIAIGDPEAVPAGVYAKESLTRLNLWDRLEPKFVRAPDVRMALIYVEQGEAEAGFVYSTDAAITGKVTIVHEFEAELTEPIFYLLVLIQHSQEKGSANRLFDYLLSEPSRRIFQTYGFHPIQREPDRQEPAHKSIRSGIKKQ